MGDFMINETLTIATLATLHTISLRIEFPFISYWFKSRNEMVANDNRESTTWMLASIRASLLSATS